MNWIISTVIGIIFLGIVLLGRIFYLISKKDENNSKVRTKPAKTIIILGSGGHTTEMLQIIKNLSFEQYSPRIYIHAKTDKISREKINEVELKNGKFKVIEIFRSREVGQSYLTSILTTLVSFKDSLKIVFNELPDLVLCNGPGTCVPLCFATFLLKIAFIKKTKIIFIESFCRVKTFSLTGKILYYIADGVIVQWPELCKSKDKHKKMCDVALITGSQIPWDIFVDNLQDFVSIELRIQLMPMCYKLRSSCEKNECLSSKEIEDSLLRLEACLDQTWEALNTGYWKDVPLNYRYCYTLCSALKCIFLEIQSAANNEKIDKREKFTEIIKQIDKAILLGAPLPNASDLMTTMASKFNEFLYNPDTESLKADNMLFDDCEIRKDLLPGLMWIKHFVSPSMETFYRDIFKPKLPAVLEGCLSNWKALKEWKDINYLMKIAGNRTVPIEIGSRYTEEDWSQSLINFADFLQSHFTKKSEKVGYLAQHQLFEQIPELKEDFAVPDYCNFTDDESEVTLPDINAWFGPRGTLSPLHFDPKNNLLSQVFGWKRIILYSPEESPNVYPYETRLLSNTAQVDPVNPNYDKWPKFKNAKGFMCYLGPGDMLFIPPGWWHHVQSLSPSFSISFWWC